MNDELLIAIQAMNERLEDLERQLERETFERKSALEKAEQRVKDAQERLAEAEYKRDQALLKLT
jgi:hypothetical protein